MNEREFVQAAEQFGAVITDEMCAQFRKYTEILLDWNGRMNLTAITDPDEIYEKHYLDSLSLLCLEGIRGRIADVGSGAGFPGLVLAIALPDAELSLIDPLAKRCTFLRAASEALGLHNVQVYNVRAEDHAKEYRETYDAVTARAVAALPELSELCVPLVKTGGVMPLASRSSSMVAFCTPLREPNWRNSALARVGPMPSISVRVVERDAPLRR